MSNAQNIRDILIAAAAQGPAGRMNTAKGAKATIEALAREIDRTVLPRRLTATFDDGSGVHCLVRNRRLHGVRVANGADLPANLSETALSVDLAEEVMHWIGDLCRQKALVRIEPGDLAPDDDLSSLGISPARLSLAAGCDAERRTPQDLERRLTEFLDNNPVAAIFAMAGEEVAVFHGEPEDVERYSELAADMLGRVTAEGSPLASALDTDGVLIFSHAEVPRGCILIAGKMGVLALAILPETGLAEAFGRWQATE